jgi:hypothetical protein
MKSAFLHGKEFWKYSVERVFSTYSYDVAVFTLPLPKMVFMDTTATITRQLRSAIRGNTRRS